ncbi:hypothetical protein CS8_055130 [Cupriavidus sp. 8B]
MAPIILTEARLGVPSRALVNAFDFGRSHQVKGVTRHISEDLRQRRIPRAVPDFGIETVKGVIGLPNTR